MCTIFPTLTLSLVRILLIKCDGCTKMWTVHFIATTHPVIPRRAAQLLDACWHTCNSESVEVCIPLLSYTLFSSEPPAMIIPSYLYDFFPLLSSSLLLYLFTSLIHLFILYLVFPFFRLFLSFLPLFLLSFFLSFFPPSFSPLFLSLLLPSFFSPFFPASTLFLLRRRRTTWRDEGGSVLKPRGSRKRRRAVKGESAVVLLLIKSTRWDETSSVAYSAIMLINLIWGGHDSCFSCLPMACKNRYTVSGQELKSLAVSEA